MKVIYKKGTHVFIIFPSTELKQALGVLKALAKHFNKGFLREVVQDMERDMAQPALGYVMHTRLCEACATEIDLRSENKHETEAGFFHKTCPTLKPNRP